MAIRFGKIGIKKTQSKNSITEQATIERTPQVFDVTLDSSIFQKEIELLKTAKDKTKNKRKKKKYDKRIATLQKQINLIHKNPVILQVEQLTPHKRFLLKEYISNLNSSVLSLQLPFLLSNFTTCVNPELLVDSDIIHIYNAEHKEEISTKQLRTLFDEILNLKIVPDEFKQYISKNSLISFYFQAKKQLLISNINYLKKLAELAINNAVEKLILKMNYAQIEKMSKAVLDYNSINEQLKKKVLSRQQTPVHTNS